MAIFCRICMGPIDLPGSHDSWYFQLRRHLNDSRRRIPFFPDVHDQVVKSWSAPQSARVHSSTRVMFSHVDGAMHQSTNFAEKNSYSDRRDSSQVCIQDDDSGADPGTNPSRGLICIRHFQSEQKLLLGSRLILSYKVSLFVCVILSASAAGVVPEVSSASVIPYTLSLSVEVRSSDRISRFESSCALDPLEFLNAQHTHATVNLSAGHRFDKDVELFLYYENSHQPSAVVEAAASAAQSGSLMGDPALMISLYPEFPADVMSSLASQGEFIFVVDRSGSMDCKMHHGNDAQMRIESARDTLLLLLKSLPMGCYFNIYGFGSHFESFFPQSVVYSEDTMEEALKRVKSMSADMGGTEILQPLKHIYSQPCYPDPPRQLFIFTDGEVWNTKELLDLVKSHVYSHRCFSFGIGEGASTALITGMAREGSGHAQFITGTDRMQPKVMQSLRFALQPAVDNISVDWTVPEGVTVDMLSPPINTLFQGQRALIYAQIKGQSSGKKEGAVTVKYRLKDQPVTNQLQFTLKPTEDTG
ncbi:von Willebrand factor A domain-containing protein 5A-like [Sinocyclocheilus grahami]|uniref:von Willebrand factor A domain-containing protein 5A-like n=1 Tax=Sinocyclocheilus grahami TaxID=75366 RepID=UPI0007AC8EE6|nr:PREDICTED: von Willebrand factor A domain-containing protein 5A-like [Sinocyclocheilus grahami]